jgi:hypothetical protein
MKYKLTADVDGVLLGEGPGQVCRANKGDLTFEAKADDRGRITSVSVIAQVPADKVERFFSTMIPTPGQVTKMHLTFGADPDFHQEVLGHVQAFESMLALNALFRKEGSPLQRLRWHETESELIPESPEEERRVDAHWAILVQSLTAGPDLEASCHAATSDTRQATRLTMSFEPDTSFAMMRIVVAVLR